MVKVRSEWVVHGRNAKLENRVRTMNGCLDGELIRISLLDGVIIHFLLVSIPNSAGTLVLWIIIPSLQPGSWPLSGLLAHDETPRVRLIRFQDIVSQAFVFTQHHSNHDRDSWSADDPAIYFLYNERTFKSSIDLCRPGHHVA
jgi:hypothetical protein